MNKLIACCGLNCETCDAYIATLKNDDLLRKQTAEKWQQMFNAPTIEPSSINCTGCRSAGVKFSHCNECGIRKCAISKGFQTCGDCSEMATCSIVAMVHQHMPEAIQNLKSLN
jgi:hypothetical protein